MTTQEIIFDTPLYQQVFDDAEIIVKELFNATDADGKECAYDGFNSLKKVDSTFLFQKN